MVLRFTLLFIRNNHKNIQKKTLSSDRVFFLFYFSRTKNIAFIFVFLSQVNSLVREVSIFLRLK